MQKTHIFSVLWKNALSWALFVVAIATHLYFYREAGTSLLQAWGQEEYSHGYLIVPLAFLWAFSAAREKRAVVRPSYAGLVGLLGAALVHLIGVLVANSWVFNMAAVLAVYACVICFFGWRTLMASWKGMVFLLFAVPLPPMMMSLLTAKMQLVSSTIGTSFLHMLAISVYQEGNIIDLGSLKLQVVEACSGLRYLFPLLGLGFLVAFLADLKMWVRLLIILSVIPITIFMNAARIAFIGIAVTIWGDQAAQGLAHDLEGWVIYVFSLLLLSLEIGLVALSRKEPIRFASPFASFADCVAIKKYTPPFLISLLVLFIGAGAIISHAFVAPKSHVAQSLAQPLDAFPLHVGSWHGRKSSLSPEELEALHLTDYFLADYTDENGRGNINFYVAYYATQKLGASPHSPMVCLPGSGWEIVSLDTGFKITLDHTGKTLTVNRAVIRKETATQIVYYWFRERGRDVASSWKIKTHLLTDALLTGRSDGALIRVSVPMADDPSGVRGDMLLKQFIDLSYSYLSMLDTNIF